MLGILYKQTLVISILGTKMHRRFRFVQQVLLLDEATSALDAESELQIQSFGR